MEAHNGEAAVELDVQESLRAILHTQARFEVRMNMVIEGLQQVMLALGVKEKLEKIATELDELEDH